MIKEAYVSFEIAKLLKEKGFNVPTEMVWYEHIPSYNVAHKRETGSKKLDYFYWDENTERNSFYTNDTNDNGMPAYIIGEVYSAPTHQMACAWLRKEHNILLFLLPAQEDGKLVYLVEVWTWNEEEGIYERTYAPMPRKEPEQSMEAAIKYCLENLI